MKLTVEGYYKRYSGYPVSTEYRTLSLANTGTFFGLEGLLFPMVSQGRGRSRGVELYVQKKLAGHVYGQLSYAYSRTEQQPSTASCDAEASTRRAFCRSREPTRSTTGSSSRQSSRRRRAAQ